MKKQEAENNFYIFSPSYQQQLLNTSKNANFGLYFSKMAHWQKKDDKPTKDTGIENVDKIDKFGQPVIDNKTGKIKTSPEQVRYDYAEDPFYKANVELFKNISSLLNTKNEQQEKYLSSMKESGLQVFSFQAITNSPFITGLGSGHPTETGMILDRNLGVPYIPASSVKGVCRMACAINIVKNNPNDFSDGKIDDDYPLLEKLFGTFNDKAEKKYRGQLVFLDVYPENTPQLNVDIMNPHFGSYYAGDNPTDKRSRELIKQPIETESPTPIKFLTVKQGTIFNFRCVYLPLKDERIDEKEIKDMFNTAWNDVGFGGKTAIGYGRFKKI